MEIFQWQPHVREQRDVLDSSEMFWWGDDGDNNPARSQQLLVFISLIRNIFNCFIFWNWITSVAWSDVLILFNINISTDRQSWACVCMITYVTWSPALQCLWLRKQQQHHHLKHELYLCVWSCTQCNSDSRCWMVSNQYYIKRF